jgi:hypothetical protein
MLLTDFYPKEVFFLPRPFLPPCNANASRLPVAAVNMCVLFLFDSRSLGTFEI